MMPRRGGCGCVRPVLNVKSSSCTFGYCVPRRVSLNGRTAPGTARVPSVTSVLRAGGAPELLGALLEGESLFNDASGKQGDSSGPPGRMHPQSRGHLMPCSHAVTVVTRTGVGGMKDVHHSAARTASCCVCSLTRAHFCG